MAISSSYLTSLYSSYSKLNSYSSLFSTSSSSSSSDSLASIVSKYTYFKENYKDIKASLTSSNDSSDTDTTSTTSTTTTSSTTSTSNYIKTKLYAGEVKSSIEKLSSDSLYETDEDGNYDTSSILSAVKDYIEDYNNLKDVSGDSTNDTVVKQAYYMVNTTTAYSSALSNIGININSDNTLSLDESKFKSANINSIKALFQGAASYGGQISNRVTQIKSAPASGYLTYTDSISSNASYLTSYLSSSNTSSSTSSLLSYLTNLSSSSNTTSSILDYFV